MGHTVWFSDRRVLRFSNWLQGKNGQRKRKVWLVATVPIAVGTSGAVPGHESCGRPSAGSLLFSRGEVSAAGCSV